MDQNTESRVEGSVIEFRGRFEHETFALIHRKTDRFMVGVLETNGTVKIIYRSTKESNRWQTESLDRKYIEVNRISWRSDTLGFLMLKILSSEKVSEKQREYFLPLNPNLLKRGPEKAFGLFMKQVLTPSLKILYGDAKERQELETDFPAGKFNFKASEGYFSGEIDSHQGKTILELPAQFSLEDLCRFAFFFLRSPLFETMSFHVSGLLLPEERSGLPLPEQASDEDLPNGVAAFLNQIK